MLQPPQQQSPATRKPVKTYLIFSQQDGDYLRELEMHITNLVRNNFIEVWHKGQVKPWENVSTAIQTHLDEASIVFVMVTANLLADSDVWENEVVPADNLRKRGQIYLVPIWIEHCQWRKLNAAGKVENIILTPFGDLKPIPYFMPESPVIDSSWKNRSFAWTLVANNISEVIYAFNKPNFKPNSNNILFMAASPNTEQRLRIDVEQRKIQDAILRSRNRDTMHFYSQPAVKFNHFVQYLLDKPSPQFVHISLHSFADGIAIEGDAGTSSRIVSGEDLYAIFEQCVQHKSQQNYPPLECVLLNACYSNGHAQLLSKLGIYAIGMKEPISDREAVAFAEGFYVGLGLGQPYPDAYSTAILHMKSQKDVPMLFKDGERIK